MGKIWGGFRGKLSDCRGGGIGGRVVGGVSQGSMGQYEWGVNVATGHWYTGKSVLSVL